MGYRLGYSGPEVDALLQKANETAIINNGWEKLASAESTPVDLNTLVTQGNYSMNFWKNGPDQLNTSGPINVCVTKDSSNNTTYQTIYDSGSIYTRETTTDTFSGGWVKNQNDTEIDIGDSAPSNPIDNYVWINTSGESPIIEIYKESINNWMAVSADDLAKASIYDPQGIKQPIDTYFDNKATEANLSAAETDYSHHITDTMYWTEEASSNITYKYWTSICYGNDKFVATSSGPNGANKFSYSSDGINWTESPLNEYPSWWTSVCYGNDKFVAVSEDENSDGTVDGRYAYSTDAINWTIGEIGDVQRRWYSVCYGNGKFVTVAWSSNYFAYSTDGINWTEGTISNTSRYWYSVCYGNDKFVVVSQSNYFAYSTDGINWTEGTISSTSRNWQSVCYGNDKFVTVAYNSNYFAYSTNGINWTEGTISSTSRNWQSVCYGNGKFVAITSSSNYYAYSTNGINWTESTISRTSRSWQSVCYGNDKFVVVGYDAYSAYLIPNNNIHVTTDDKTTWAAGISKTDANTYLDAFKSDMSTYADEQINNTSAIADDLTAQINTLNTNITTHIADSSVHITEEDAARWDAKAPGDHTHNNDGTVTVSAENVVGLIPIERLDPSVLERNYTVNSYSEMMALTKNEIQNGDSVYINETHPTAWFVIDDTKLGEETPTATEGTISSTSRNWCSVCYGNDKFVAVAYNSKYFAYSTDGITWTEGTISDTSRYWYSVCYGNGKFVTVAWSSNYFAYSTDGINWTEGTISNTSRYWYSVCYGNDKFVVVSQSNYFAYSTDGINWTESTISNTSRNWRSVCYGNGKFVTVGYTNNYFAYSYDGINWTEGTISDTSRQWNSVCYGNGKYVTVANNSNHFAYSTDGINWTESTISDTSRRWYSVCYGNGKFVTVVYNSNYFAYSTDGINWTEGTLPSNIWWYSVCYGNDKIVAVAYNSNNFANISLSPTGLIQYATPAKDLTWDNIENKPNTLAGYNITDCYTKDEIYSLYNTIITNLTNTKTRAENLSALVTTEIPSDLDTTISTNKQLSADINYKMNLLIKNAKFDSALTDSIVGLVNNA